MSSPVSPTEQRRVAQLHTLKLLDTPPEPSFDRVVEGLAQLYQVPIALITFLDHERQFIKAAVGTEERSRPLPSTLCQYTLASDDVLVIPDLTQDARGQTHPLVTQAPHARFYAGAPIIVQGQRIGTVCVLDLIPRNLLAREVDTLGYIAHLLSITLYARMVGFTGPIPYPHWQPRS